MNLCGIILKSQPEILTGTSDIVNSYKFLCYLHAACLLLGSSGCKSSSCNLEQLKESTDREIVVSKAEDFSVIEAGSMKKISLNPDVPQMPFGYRHEKWLAFKKKFQDGDCLVYFTTPEKAWKRLAGLEGYAIMRGNEVIAVFVLKVS